MAVLRRASANGGLVADIFISYSKTERHLTESLAGDLAAAGYTVWWDTNLITGDNYQTVIVNELRQARAAIVIWTPASTQSEWVYSEASRANREKKLIPVRVQEVDLYDIPPPFDVRQTELVSNRRAIFVALRRMNVLPAQVAPEQTGVAAAPPLPLPHAPRRRAAEPRSSEPSPAAAPTVREQRQGHADLPQATQERTVAAAKKSVEHWHRTRRLAFGTLAVWLLLALGIHLGAASLNELKVLGFPLGYYMAAQGSLVGCVCLLYWFVRRQNLIDREGALAA